MRIKTGKAYISAVIMALFFTSLAGISFAQKTKNIIDGKDLSSAAVAVAVVTAISPETRELTLKDGITSLPLSLGLKSGILTRSRGETSLL